MINAFLALVGSAIAFYLLNDSPEKNHEPQGKPLSFKNVRNSLGDVLTRKHFWMVAFGQFSNCLVRTAERILGSFYVDTTDVDEATAGGLTVFLAAGFLVGIFILGPIFR